MSKALFRATKAKPKVDPRQAPMFDDLPKDRAPVNGARVARDYYPTGQPEAILALLSADGERIRACGNVWEPACGKGDMVRHIRAAGIPCCASDIEDRGCPDSCSMADVITPEERKTMGRVWKSRTVRDVLDDPGCDQQFEAFAQMILKPPLGLKTMTATSNELREIRDRLDRIQKRRRT